MSLGTASLSGLHKGRLAVEQLYGYMVRNAKTFGILTTLRGWCFAYRGNQGQLVMTRMFASHPQQQNTLPLPGYWQPNITTMMAIYYLSRLSFNTGDTYEILPPGQVGELELPFADPDTSSAAPKAKARDPPNQGRQGPQYIAPAPHYQQGPQYSYTIHFEPWVKENQLGGKSWMVDLIPTHSKAVLKLYGEDEFMKQNEIQTYRHLEPLWSRCIPRFLAVDILEHSNSILIEYIEVNPSYLPCINIQASPLSVNTLTDEMESKILNVFESIHQLGVVHNDVKFDNVLTSQDGSVWIVDFEHAGTGGELAYDVELRLVRDMICELREKLA
jgi:hypothetical protein